MRTSSMTIGEVATQAGVRASAIRFYEKAGLLPKPSRLVGNGGMTKASYLD